MTSAMPASCISARELASAELDGEFLDDSEARNLELHLRSCVTCPAWIANATSIHRSLRLSASDEVPDLSAQILTVVRRQQLQPTAASMMPMARLGLGVIALAIVVGALSEMLGGNGWARTHSSQELLSFQLALAGGFGGAALRPRWAGGVAVSSVIAAVVLVATAIAGVRSGGTSGTIEFNHVLEVVGACLCCVIARSTNAVGYFGRSVSPKLTT